MAEESLYNSRILSTYLEFTKKNYPQVSIQELLDYARLESYQISDEGHWFNQEQHDRFHQKLVELTGNKEIAREAGQYAAASKGMGFFRQYALAWMGPVAAYAMLGRLTAKVTRASIYESRKISSNSIEITVTPRKGVQEKPYQCENRWGMLQAIFDFFNYQLSRSDHPECIFKGGKACRYIFSWEPPPSTVWKKIRKLMAVSLLAVGGLLIPLFPWDTVVIISILSVFFLMTYIIGFLEKKELTSTINHFRKSAEEQIDQIDINYKNAMMINEIGQAINKKLNIKDIMENIMQAFKMRLDYDRGMILLTNPEKTHLVFSAGFGLEEGQVPKIENSSFHLDKPESKGAFVLSFREQKPFLVNDTGEIQDHVSEKSLEFLLSTGSKSFICCPIIYEKDPLGILVVDNIREKRVLTQTDVSLLMGIANQIGISINNARMIDQQKKQFNSILRVLAASIDARDPLTAGHSEKVTEYSLGIARELGLDETFCEVISIAALLHDYGKIGIRDEILKKPGALTYKEHIEIRSHALKTKLILDQMNFSEEYSEIPFLAGAHHEKVDGTGYPKGLKGEEIPLGARIIAVADVFEALTAKRHYRDPMEPEEALNILKEGINTAFDKKIVEAFFSYYQKTFIQNKARPLGLYETLSPRPLIQGPASTLH
jgi:HD-GYP domain-containing protein (c-di-GMP phosphodiesterase class II)